MFTCNFNGNKLYLTKQKGKIIVIAKETVPKKACGFEKEREALKFKEKDKRI